MKPHSLRRLLRLQHGWASVSLHIHCPHESHKEGALLPAFKFLAEANDVHDLCLHFCQLSILLSAQTCSNESLHSLEHFLTGQDLRS